MTATLGEVTKKTKREPTPEERPAEEMVQRAREQGLSLTGPDWLLKQLTKTVLETALNQELTGHLGHEKHGRPDPGSGNIRNGTRAKTVLTESTGHVQVQVPRDRDGSFGPQIVKKRQRRLTGVDEIVLSLYAKGLTTGEISAHCDGLKGLPEAIGAVWPLTTVQTCIIHLIRNTFHLASKRDRDVLKRGIKPICTAVNATTAREALDQLAETWDVTP